MFTRLGTHGMILFQLPTPNCVAAEDETPEFLACSDVTCVSLVNGDVTYEFRHETDNMFLWIHAKPHANNFRAPRNPHPVPSSENRKRKIIANF